MTQPAPGAAICVVGGGISGISAAIEAAEAGHDVVLLERESYLGGRVIRLNEYFPKLCPPTCGFEINLRRLKVNPRVRILTQAEVINVSGEPGAYTLDVQLQPRFVNGNCTACNACVEACPEYRSDAFNYGMGQTKAIYLPHGMAYPLRHIVDPEACLGEACSKCVAYCEYDAIELDAEPKTIQLSAASVLVATGWKPYDARRLETLGFGQYADVVTNAMLERMAAQNGPSEGEITRLSDGGPLESVAFVQCAGSRDENHLAHCSTVCCTASIKQARYIRERYPDAQIHIFYIDIRTMGTLEDFYDKVLKEDERISLHKGKVAKIYRDPGQKGVTVVAEDMVTGQRRHLVVDLAVLATGMQPEGPIPGVDYDAQGFVAAPADGVGVRGIGCAHRPVEVATAVRDATAGALQAIITKHSRIEA